jgi:hypothetical protein
MVMTSPMGFHNSRPLAALVVFRACLQWRAFQADRTSVFDHIYQVSRHVAQGHAGCNRASSFLHHASPCCAHQDCVLHHTNLCTPPSQLKALVSMVYMPCPGC